MRLVKPIPVTGRRFTAKLKGVRFELGNVYSFFYNPIHKKTLMFYDKNPLVLFMEFHPSTNTLFGVNLHYLPIDERQELVDAVIEEKDDIKKFFKWEKLYNKPQFRNMPVGFRKYKVGRLNGVEEIVNIQEDTEVDRDDLKIKRIIKSERGFRYNQTIATKVNKLAQSNRDWKEFLRGI